jgi:crotonobetainyl-CoA:carnitine CoA-transferase CaiB-like acyl-CoA transferase
MRRGIAPAIGHPFMRHIHREPVASTGWATKCPTVDTEAEAQTTAVSNRSEDSGGPLDGVRVIDLSTTVMGPYATQLLAQLGADVVKIETPDGDIVRGIGDRDNRRLGPVFLNLNRGKRSIILNLRSDSDYREFLGYVADCDVLVHNKPPAAAKRLRIDYDTIAHANGRLIYCMVQGFGHGGPYRDRPAYDDIIQAASGMAHIQGGAGKPTYVRSPIADKVTALFALSAINAALYAREREPHRGQCIVVPMFESMVSFVLAEAQGDWVYWPPRGKPGYARMNSPHREPFPTADGMISVMPNTDAHWNAFFEFIGAPEADPRYRDITARTENIDALYALMASELKKRTTAYWIEAFDAVGIPAMPLLDIPDLFVDPHLAAVEFFEITDHPVEGPLRQPRFPITFSRTACKTVGPAPGLGAG